METTARKLVLRLRGLLEMMPRLMQLKLSQFPVPRLYSCNLLILPQFNGFLQNLTSLRVLCNEGLAKLMFHACREFELDNFDNSVSSIGVIISTRQSV
jgi:hypothetical protein